jgi:hypothetical protein
VETLGRWFASNFIFTLIRFGIPVRVILL